MDAKAIFNSSGPAGREDGTDAGLVIAELLTESEPRPDVKTPEKGPQVSRLDSNVSRSGKREPR